MFILTGYMVAHIINITVRTHSPMSDTLSETDLTGGCTLSVSTAATTMNLYMLYAKTSVLCTRTPSNEQNTWMIHVAEHTLFLALF